MRFSALVALVVCAVVGSCVPETPDDGVVDTPVGPIVVRSLGPLVSADIDGDGGTITVDVGDRTVSLVVPPTALRAVTTIGVEPVVIEGVDADVAVRFSPSGLVFDLPATMVMSAVDGEEPVGLTFDDDATIGELHFPIIADDTVSMPIAHFSVGAIADRRRAVRDRLDDDDRALLAALEERLERDVAGFAEQLRVTVQPAVDRAGTNARSFQVAAALFDRWSTQLQGAAIIDEAIEIRGTETFRGAINRLLTTLQTTGSGLLASYEQPRCDDVGGQVRAPVDWLVLHGTISDAFQLLFGDTRPNGVLCARGRIVIDGNRDLTDTDDTVTVDVGFEVVGPDDVADRIGPVVFSLVATGATLATDSIGSANGTADGVVLTRPAVDRPRAVQLVVSVDLSGTPTPVDTLDVEPAVFTASEALVATTTADPPTLAAGGTSQVCTRVTANGADLLEFDATYTLTGPGRLADISLVTTTGELCNTYTAPASTAEPTATVGVTVDIDGVPLVTAAVLTLASRFVSVSPSSASITVGSDVLLNALVVGETDQQVTWSSTGGVVDGTGRFSSDTSGTFTITATSVADPTLRGRATVTASCAFAPGGLPQNDQRFSQTSALGRVLDRLGPGNTVLADERDVAEEASSVTGSGTGYRFASSATASERSLHAEAELTVADPIVADSIGSAQRFIHLAAISGSGNGVARVTVDLDCTTGVDGSFRYQLDIDPNDDFGSDRISVSRNQGTGPTTFHELVTLETTISLGTGDLFMAHELTVSQDGNCTANVISKRVSISGCQ